MNFIVKNIGYKITFLQSKTKPSITVDNMIFALFN